VRCCLGNLMDVLDCSFIEEIFSGASQLGEFFRGFDLAGFNPRRELLFGDASLARGFADSVHAPILSGIRGHALLARSEIRAIHLAILAAYLEGMATTGDKLPPGPSADAGAIPKYCAQGSLRIGLRKIPIIWRCRCPYIHATKTKRERRQHDDEFRSIGRQMETS
jgi:hypothetical protein